MKASVGIYQFLQNDYGVVYNKKVEQSVGQKSINQVPTQTVQSTSSPVNKNDQLLIEQIRSGQRNFCPGCHNLVDSIFLFCPNCGHKLKEPSMTLGKQIGIYLLSFFLPPMGLWPAFRCLRQSDSKSKKIGIAALVLTLASTVLTIISLLYMFQYAGTYTSQLNSETNLYKTLQY